jgi:hypothetical protein
VLTLLKNEHLDERQQIIEKNVLTRSFGFLFFLIVGYLILSFFINVNSTINQLILISIITVTHLYIWVDSYINKILYFDEKENSDIKKKLKSFAQTIFILDILLILLIISNSENIDFSLGFCVFIIFINFILVSFYYVILRLWTKWYK